jgi:hypothetical protein
MIAYAPAPAVGDLPEPFQHRLLARLDRHDLELLLAQGNMVLRFVEAMW